MTRTLTILSLLALAQPAFPARTVELLEGAYEASADTVTLPGSAAGTAIIRPCADCDPVSLSVDSQTRYVADGRDVSLAEFGQAVATARQTSSEPAAVLLTVHYGLESGRATRLVLSTN